METENAIRQRVYELAVKNHEKGQPITVQELANIVDPKEPDNFIVFANSEEFNLSGEIHIDRKGILKLVNISGSDSMVSVKFSTEALDKNRVTYDLEKDYMTIQKIPEGIKKQLRMYDGGDDE